jgi:hypothetical protein
VVLAFRTWPREEELFRLTAAVKVIAVTPQREFRCEESKVEMAVRGWLNTAMEEPDGMMRARNWQEARGEEAFEGLNRRV